MSDEFKGIEPMVYESKINVPYSWWAGDTATKFFNSLQDEKKIIAPRCKACKKVFLPPRKVCPDCFTENTEWVDLADTGTLQSYTIARRQLASIPKNKKITVIRGLIKVDGADTALLHYLDEVKPEDVKIGMRVQAVFAAMPKGTIRDIAYFKPVK
jgi:hypothetical protein